MKPILNPVVWSEGTLLTQQHFQQWQLFLEQQRIETMKMSEPYYWGVQSLSIDESALLNGVFRVKECQAIFPHGQLVMFNTEQSGELTCDLRDDHADSSGIYLCIPLNQQIAGLSGYSENKKQSGWRTKYETIQDLYDLSREREVAFGEANLMLLRDDQDRNEMASIKCCCWI